MVVLVGSHHMTSDFSMSKQSSTHEKISTARLSVAITACGNLRWIKKAIYTLWHRG